MLVANGLSAEVLRWKATGEPFCYEWTPQQIFGLGITMKKHIEANIDKFHTLRAVVTDEEQTPTADDIQWITW